jgi:serine/threonine protein kinase
MKKINNILKFEEFEFKERVGYGAFGKVFRSIHIETNTICAIKKIKDEDKFRKSAKKEIEILNDLMVYYKENEFFPIINFYGDFMKNNIQYLVFEYMDINLYHYYKNYYSLINLDTIINIIYNVCKGLEFIHRKYIHADLKPENIMINRETRMAKIIDLGSSFNKGGGKTNFYIQSRYYRSPEIIFNIQFNEKIDIWSLGCIFAELIINKPLFPGRNIRDLIFKIAGKIDVPKNEMYKKNKNFNMFFSSYDSIEDNDTEEEYFYLHDNFTDTKDYNKPEYNLDIYLEKYIQILNEDEIQNKNIIDFICNTLVYDFDKRPSAEKCLEHLIFTNKKNTLL